MLKNEVLMKKLKKIAIVTLISIFSIIILYYISWALQTVDASKKMNQYLELSGIPADEVFVVEKIEAHQKFFFSDKWYTKTITTKKDYNQWKQQVLKTGRLYNHKKLKDKNYVNNIKNCEVLYYLTYYHYGDDVYGSYGINGEDKVTSALLQENFHYRLRTTPDF